MNSHSGETLTPGPLGAAAPLQNYRNLRFMVAADAVMFACAYLGAYLIRFEGDIPYPHSSILATTTVPIILCKMTLAHFFGLYRGMWRYTSLVDLMNVVKTAVASTLLIYTAVHFSERLTGFSRAVFLLDGLLTLLFVGGLRSGIRLYYTHTLRQFFGSDFYTLGRKDVSRRNLLIVGAGDAGEAILRELNTNPASPYDVVGFIDDDVSSIGKYIHGKPILGDTRTLAEIVRLKDVDEVLIAKSVATSKEMRGIIERCEAIGVKCRTIPSVSEFIDGRVSLKFARDVSFEDLLGRESVDLEVGRIGGYLTGKRILVTGAGGSIGSELCRQISMFKPEALYLLDRSESALYEIEMELRHYNTIQVRHEPILMAVQNQQELRKVFQRIRPEAVFHAAAYKHVPMMEGHPWEAVYNNIVATQVLLRMCREFGDVERFVLVSTDKAVRPTNVMGASKRVAELLTQAYDAVNDHTTHQAVRFGNVAGSAGSVIPLFTKQIEKRGAVTVTHPEVTRFFMTIPESAQLILQAGAMGHGGEIFILDMGEPIKIIDLARDLIRLSGFEPDVDIPIEIVGLRPGEKLYEEMITIGEDIGPTDHGKIMVLRSNGTEGGSRVQERFEMLERAVADLMALAEEQDSAAIRAKLREIVPEYVPAGSTDSDAGSTDGSGP